MGITHPKYKAAVVQAAPVWIDLEFTVAKTIRYIEEAAKEGAKLIAFPETWIPGYPWYIWVGTPAWAIGKGFVQRYFDNSLSYDSPLAQKIADAARDNKITVVLGLSERDGGSLYISQWLIGPDGKPSPNVASFGPPMSNERCSAKETAVTSPFTTAPTWGD
jgi:nitrilase